VLDLACGAGRHAIAAAEMGCDVVAVDQESDRIRVARATASLRGVSVTWKSEDLTTVEVPEAAFDVVMIFNYLDRNRMEDFKRAVRPGGHLMFETFLESQREFGWGPSSDEHLLKHGELLTLVEPFEVIFAREVIEPVDSRTAAVASVIAQRRK
jgi:2-polyprenyl-3-methyl-5-hydroxy-6-metoxy-1,4-benzoquinol methylase